MEASILSNRVGRLRPLIHFTSQKGWINDPNGLIYYKGKYHLFYQFNPFGTEWSKMHWGHAVSTDMLHWEDLPIALTPDEKYENDMEGGCFSGSAIEKDGKLYLIYTASAHIDGKLQQRQCIAYSDDGVTFEKYDCNPVIDRPEGAAPDFRDPKVFEHGGKYYIVIGGSMNGDGAVFLYSSDNLLNWEYEGILFSSNGKHGWMIECPDFFFLDGKWVLVFSPMSSPDRKKCVYLTGDMDFNSCSFSPLYYNNADYGFDYYAPQSFLDKNGRRISIAWLNRWLWMPFAEDWGPTEDEGWRGALSIPRVLHCVDNRLIASPIEEMKLLFSEGDKQMVEITETTSFLQKRDKSCVYTVEYKSCDIESAAFSIKLFESARLDIDLLSLTAVFSYMADGKGFMTAPLRKTEGHDIKIIIDGSIVEIFLDGGYSTISVNVFKEYDSIEFSVPYKKAVLFIEKGE